MRILDELNNELLEEEIDCSKGYLREENIFVKHHDAVEAVEEEGHWEIVAEYPNGGRDVEWVIDVPGITAKEAWDEYEDIYRYIEYTAEKLEAIEEERNKPTTEELLNILLGVTE